MSGSSRPAYPMICAGTRKPRSSTSNRASGLPRWFSNAGQPSAAHGLAYQVSNATLTGTTAVVTVSLAGIASAIGSKSVALKYSAGRWGLLVDDLGIYSHRGVQADIAAAKAAGYCAKS